VLLTLLLLTPDPWRLLGLRRVAHAIPIPNRGVHFTLFLGLTLLMHASRWPLRRIPLLLGLAGYAVAAELLQTFVPPRTVELIDALENLAGIALGAFLFRLADRRWCSAAPRDPACDSKAASPGDT
jgi:hypothetical protein